MKESKTTMPTTIPDLENLLRAVRFGDHRYKANLERFEREAESKGALAAMGRCGYDAVVAQAYLAAMDEATLTLRNGPDLRQAIYEVVRYSNTLSGERSMRSDVIEQLADDSKRRAYSLICSALLPYLEA